MFSRSLRNNLLRIARSDMFSRSLRNNLLRIARSNPAAAAMLAAASADSNPQDYTVKILVKRNPGSTDRPTVPASSGRATELERKRWDDLLLDTFSRSSRNGLLTRIARSRQGQSDPEVLLRTMVPSRDNEDLAETTAEDYEWSGQHNEKPPLVPVDPLANGLLSRYLRDPSELPWLRLTSSQPLSEFRGGSPDPDRYSREVREDEDMFLRSMRLENQDAGPTSRTRMGSKLAPSKRSSQKLVSREDRTPTRPKRSAGSSPAGQTRSKRQKVKEHLRSGA